jgi:hypothetical protein
VSDDFVRDLEDELAAAARFRATHPRRRFPRVPVGALIAVATAAAVVIALIGLTGGERERPADRTTPGPAPSTVTANLVPMQPLRDCATPGAERLPAPPIRGVGLLARPQREGDALPFEAARLPLGGFEPGATRRTTPGRLVGDLHVVPSGHVSAINRCGEDDGPGACLAAAARHFACFTAADIGIGRAVALVRDGVVAGLVPDGITRVTLAGHGAPVTVAVRDNVYEAGLDEIAGTGIQLMFGRAEDGCGRKVAPDLLLRVTALLEPAQPGLPLPDAALDVLNEWMWALDAIVVDGARYWGGGDGVDFWVVPVVPSGSARCAPATRVCVVAVPQVADADAHCVLGRNRDGMDWRLGPLLRDRAVVYGVVPDGIDEGQVTIGGRSARVEAGLNVIGGVVPFPYRRGSDVRLIREGPLTPEPRVIVVGAGGDAGAAVARLTDAGYDATSGALREPAQQEGTAVYWDRRRVTREATARVAGVVGADDRFEAGNAPPALQPRLDMDASVVVVVGSG